MSLSLLNNCLAGSADGWQELYNWLQPVILDSTELSDEVAARVWFQLVRDDFSLLRRFDPERGTLVNYVRAIARMVKLDYLKRESKFRATRVGDGASSPPVEQIERTEGVPAVSYEEFLQVLTRRELEYFKFCLSPQTESEFSATNERKLRSRVRKKLLDYLQT